MSEEPLEESSAEIPIEHQEPPKEGKSDTNNISDTNQVIITLLAGGMAGALSKTAIAPLDRLKIVFQISPDQRYTTKQAWKFIVDSYKTDGVVSLWRGNTATMARIIPYAAIQFAVYEQVSKLLLADVEGPHTAFKRFIAGSSAGLASTSATYPLDVARARMAILHRDKYKCVMHVFVKTWVEDGPTALFRGYLPTMLGIIPYAGISFCLYESIKTLHKDYNRQGACMTPVERVVCGGFAGLVGQMSSYPLEVVRRRMQIMSNSSHSMMDMLVKIYKLEGVLGGLYKGMSINWIKGPIAVGISFATYDTLVEVLRILVLHYL